MPGINFVCSTDPLSPRQVVDSLDELRWKDSYRITQLVSDKHVLVAFSEYENYPHQTYENDDILVLIEGLIYNRSDSEIEASLRSIAEDFKSNRDYRTRIKNCIDSFDGEYFVLLYLKKSRDVLIFNDRWARMPAFYSTQNNRFIFSREIKFILHWIPRIEFDRMWMTEFLAFEYNLGDKCLIKGIKSMRPSALLHIRLADNELSVTQETLLPPEFDPVDSRMSRSDTLERCADLFRKSLKSRVRKIKEKGYGIVTDLSGGHDTRAIFAGLCNLGVDFLTCNDHLSGGDEGEIAKKVARLYGRNLVHFNAPHPVDDVSELQKVTCMTDCLVNCYTATTCFYDDLEREKAISGKQTHFMGLGGEFLRQRYMPIRGYRGVMEMLEDDGFTNAFRIFDACAITRVKRTEFSSNLEYEIGRFPETDVTGKIAHLNFERYNKFDNAGENRHRLFSWVVSPFWGKDLFEFVMRHIPVRSIDYIFFVDFLRKLDPATMEVPIYSGIMGINPLRRLSWFNARVKLKKAMRTDRYLYRIAKWAMSRRLSAKKTEKDTGWISEEILKIAAGSETARACFDIDFADELGQNYPEKLPLYQLLTLVLYVEQIEKRFGSKISIDS